MCFNVIEVEINWNKSRISPKWSVISTLERNFFCETSQYVETRWNIFSVQRHFRGNHFVRFRTASATACYLIKAREAERTMWQIDFYFWGWKDRRHRRRKSYRDIPRFPSFLWSGVKELVREIRFLGSVHTENVRTRTHWETDIRSTFCQNFRHFRANSNFWRFFKVRPPRRFGARAPAKFKFLGFGTK